MWSDFRPYYVGYFDGALRDGKMTFGCVLYDFAGKIIFEDGKWAKERYNTVDRAEFYGLSMLAEFCQKNNISPIRIFGDSDSVCYAMKNDNISDVKKALKEQILVLLNNTEYEISWIPRDKNKADRTTKIHF